MRRVEDVLGKGWENHVEGQKLKADGDSFRLKLNIQQLFNEWTEKVCLHCTQHLLLGLPRLCRYVTAFIFPSWAMQGVNRTLVPVTSNSPLLSTGIIRFFTKQIATEGFSTAFGQSRCALWHTKSIKPRKFGNIVKMRLENEKNPYSPHVKSCGTNVHRFSKQIS